MLSRKGVPRSRPLVERFWEKVQKSDGCWLWTGQVDERKWKYGRIHHQGRRIRAHRVSWMVHYGPIPDGMVVCHRCDNPRCVRPEHLFLGTVADNNRDMKEKGRARSIGGRPTKLTDAEVLQIRALRGSATRAVLAARFNVSPKTIANIHSGHNRPVVTGEVTHVGR